MIILEIIGGLLVLFLAAQILGRLARFVWIPILSSVIAGLVVGGASMICAMCIGIITGGAYVTLMLVRKRLNKTDQFAFGPFLAFGLATAIFLGDKMAVWYLQFGAV